MASASKSEITGINQSIAQSEALIKTLTAQEANLPFPVTATAAESIAAATVPSAPYSPNWIRNLALALLAGLALGFGVVFIRERLDDRFVGREDLEETAGAPVLAIVPSVAELEAEHHQARRQGRPQDGAGRGIPDAANERRLHGPHERAQDDLDGQPEHG